MVKDTVHKKYSKQKVKQKMFNVPTNPIFAISFHYDKESFDKNAMIMTVTSNMKKKGQFSKLSTYWRGMGKRLYADELLDLEDKRALAEMFKGFVDEFNV